VSLWRVWVQLQVNVTKKNGRDGYPTTTDRRNRTEPNRTDRTGTTERPNRPEPGWTRPTEPVTDPWTDPVERPERRRIQGLFLNQIELAENFQGLGGSINQEI